MPTRYIKIGRERGSDELVIIKQFETDSQSKLERLMNSRADRDYVDVDLYQKVKRGKWNPSYQP